MSTEWLPSHLYLGHRRNLAENIDILSSGRTNRPTLVTVTAQDTPPVCGHRYKVRRGDRSQNMSTGNLSLSGLIVTRIKLAASCLGSPGQTRAVEKSGKEWGRSMDFLNVNRRPAGRVSLAVNKYSQYPGSQAGISLYGVEVGRETHAGRCR